MSQQSYNFFGLGPGQMAPSQSPSALAQAMQLQEYNNPTSAQSAQGGGAGAMGGINPQMLAQMMMKQPPSPAAMNPSGAEGMGPYQLPWLNPINGGSNG